ncbi:hypothetical protein S245_024224, partial [Arachis hypogaea]
MTVREPRLHNSNYDAQRRQGEDDFPRQDDGQENIATVCRYVILGNHRDAWAFVAVDPNSGTAALLERGVTEWVEENRKLLASSVVA